MIRLELEHTNTHTSLHIFSQTLTSTMVQFTVYFSYKIIRGPYDSVKRRQCTVTFTITCSALQPSPGFIRVQLPTVFFMFRRAKNGRQTPVVIIHNRLPTGLGQPTNYRVAIGNTARITTAFGLSTLSLQFELVLHLDEAIKNTTALLSR